MSILDLPDDILCLIVKVGELKGYHVAALAATCRWFRSKRQLMAQAILSQMELIFDVPEHLRPLSDSRVCVSNSHTQVAVVCKERCSVFELVGAGHKPGKLWRLANYLRPQPVEDDDVHWKASFVGEDLIVLWPTLNNSLEPIARSSYAFVPDDSQAERATIQSLVSRHIAAAASSASSNPFGCVLLPDWTLTTDYKWLVLDCWDIHSGPGAAWPLGVPVYLLNKELARNLFVPFTYDWNQEITCSRDFATPVSTADGKHIVSPHCGYPGINVYSCPPELDLEEDFAEQAKRVIDDVLEGDEDDYGYLENLCDWKYSKISRVETCSFGGGWKRVCHIADEKYYERFDVDETGRRMFDDRCRSDIALSGNMVVVSRFDTEKVDGVYDGCIEIIRIPPQLNSSK
eukprot:m.317498 g.317498  ORF g.317498 m.317498 type:complete len:402 (+) comp16508_c0_seq2:90-1295(+)